MLGGKPPARVVVNEFTTVASVWTNAQFLDGVALQGHALGLRIAAGNVPSFVDLGTGGWGVAIQDPLNSGQTPTMANFATLADVLAGCAAQVSDDACSKLFSAATPPTGSAPTDTLTAAEAIARYPWFKPERLFALLDCFHPMAKGKIMRPTPFNPYLSFAPSAWVLPLKFDGGGYRAGGKAMFDSAGNLWSAIISRSVGRRRTPCGRKRYQVRAERPSALAHYHGTFRRLKTTALAEFDGNTDIHAIVDGQTVKFLFRDQVLVRFKKANSKGIGSNIETQAVLEFVDPQLKLPQFLPEIYKIESATSWINSRPRWRRLQ